MEGLSVRTVAFEFLGVEETAQILRVNPHTLYRAIRRKEVPVMTLGCEYRIHVSFLGWEYVPPPEIAKLESDEVAGQLAFEFDVPVRGIKVYRNTGKPVRVGDYELALSHNRKWRNPSRDAS
jgi:hypothetical protein